MRLSKTQTLETLIEALEERGAVVVSVVPSGTELRLTAHFEIIWPNDKTRSWGTALINKYTGAELWEIAN